MRPSTTGKSAAAAAGQTKIPKTVANGSFEVVRKLGEGCFGEVYSGVDSKTGHPVAIKFEPCKQTDLSHEVAIMKSLAKPEQPQGFTRIYHFGREGVHNCLVMERLGHSLMDLSKAVGGRFSAETAALVAQQAVRCLEILHSRGIVHRDIKPENFMCGVGNRKHHLYLIDFGMACKYYTNGKHVPFRSVASFSGNLRYASINAHRMNNQSRRDDLEALGHMLYFFLLGRLPWSGLQATSWRDQNRKVMEKKESIPLQELNADHPAAFREYLAYCRGLGFSSKPDYAMCEGFFVRLRAELSKRKGRSLEDHDLDWMQEEDKRDCEPWRPRTLVSQPEEAATATRAAASGRLRGWGLLCGGSRAAAVAEPELPLAVAAA
eukprot:CAMPEP_0115373028 /NCGR_PEP_ID=MMETSP0271-20121206/1212_1 /TAXON_ID=71861 /ORGANISM="Scrippsiella trochoidea, Strain CCMP3099" /LENGTH=376 /DNA_ID=CAMNT_0002796001 /DNA_START=61 /DNA_END=1191 /DNA_ORIENTATION=+